MTNKRTHRKPDYPKTLLIVGGNFQGGGQIFLRDAFQPFPKDKVIRYSLIQDNQPLMMNDWYGFRNIIDVHPPEIPAKVFKFWGSRPLNYIAALYFHIISRSIAVRKIVLRIQNIINIETFDRILIVLNSPVMIWLANALLKLNYTISVIVWDPPESFINSLSFSKPIADILLKDFEFVIRNSAFLGTASDGMRLEYSDKYMKDSTVLIHSVPRSLFKKTKGNLVSKKDLVIGFAGNLYATNEWNALLAALDKVNWCVGTHQVKINVLGNGLCINTANLNTQVTFWGWRGLEETIKILNNSDIGYLPYWLDENRLQTVGKTFPNKISVYLAAGIPILYHGPIQGSPEKFLSKYPAGMSCHSLSLDDIISKLETIVTNKDFFRKTAESINKARIDELNLDEFQTRFKRVLGVS